MITYMIIKQHKKKYRFFKTYKIFYVGSNNSEIKDKNTVKNRYRSKHLHLVLMKCANFQQFLI